MDEYLWLLLLLQAHAVFKGRQMLLVNHSVSLSCLELLFRELVVTPRALLHWLHVKLAVLLLVGLTMVLALDLARVARARLPRCFIASRDFIVLVRVRPLGSSFGEGLFARHASILVGSGEILTHLGASALRIFSVLLAESAMTIAAVDATASAASPPVQCELGG